MKGWGGRCLCDEGMEEGVYVMKGWREMSM